jgi:hypothetical protein
MGMNRRAWAAGLGAAAFAVLVPLAMTRETPTARGQIVPPGGGAVTTPQPTVACTTIQGTCGPTGGTAVNPFAYVNRYCNGDAVAVPPGETAYELVYGIGGNTPPALFPSGSGSFFGIGFVNGVQVPTQPLDTLPIGGRDQRLQHRVVGSAEVFTINMWVTSNGLIDGPRVPFGNGQTLKIIEVSGSCPGVVPGPPVDSTTPGAVPPPVTNTVPGTGTIVPVL